MKRLVEFGKKWRGTIAKVAMVFIFTFLLYWGWQNWTLLLELATRLGGAKFLFVLAWLECAYLMSALALWLLTRTVRTDFTFAETYHALNFSQVAGSLPGGIWGIAGLAGWLWSKGFSKADSAFLVTVNLLFALSACALVGVLALTSTLGPQFLLLGLLPLALWFLMRNVIDRQRNKFFLNSSPLPTRAASAPILLANVAVWVIEAGCFAWLVRDLTSAVLLSPLMLVSAYAAAYLAGFFVLIAPAGLGVREGVLAALLGNAGGAEQIFAIALMFRFSQTLIQWLNVFISWLWRFGARNAPA